MQVSRWVGLYIVAVAAPIIYYDTSSTLDRVETIRVVSNTPEARRKACIEKTKPLNLPHGHRTIICNCSVSRAIEQGATREFGAYDGDHLERIIEQCARDKLNYR